MKVLIVFAGAENDLHGWPDYRSLAMQRLSGNNVLGHVLNQLREVQIDELVVLVERDEAAVSAWLNNHVQNVDAHVILHAPELNPLQALLANQMYFDEGERLLVLGSAITEADYAGLIRSTEDVALLVRPKQPGIALPQNENSAASSWAGVCHFGQGTDLQVALKRALAGGSADFAAFVNELRRSELTFDERVATLCLDTGTIEGLLFANARLLGLGYGSEDAIERSYVEDFTVIPPVFLHETAEIENSIIGPYVNVEAGARISSSVISNSLIGMQTTIDHAVLEGSLVGDQACVKGVGKSLIVESNQEVAIDT